MLASGLFLFERVDQFQGGVEPDAPVQMGDGLYAERGGEVGLAGPGSADEHDVVGLLHELAAVQLADQRCVHRALGEVEAGEVAVRW